MIADRVAAVRQRIARAAARAGRKAGDVTLVAVSKTFPAEGVREAFAAGVRDFGENRVQEAEAKVPALTDLQPQGLRWHLVGHLQKNKSKKAVALFDVIQSLDEVDLAHHVEHYAAQQGKVIPALVQVDLAGEESKFGVDEKLLFPALESLRSFKSVRVQGLMVLPPFSRTRRGSALVPAAAGAPRPGGCGVAAPRLGAVHGHEPRPRGSDRGRGHHGARGDRDLRRTRPAAVRVGDAWGVSIVTGVLTALAAVALGQMWMAALSALFAYNAVQDLRGQPGIQIAG